MRRVKEIIHYDYEMMKKMKCLGRNVVVAVLDTGAAPHPELENRILLFEDFVGGKRELYDDCGHGTHVAGIIAGKRIGIAPECHLVILKVLDEKGRGKTEHCLQGVRWITENQEKYNIRIVNISIGMEADASQWKRSRLLSEVENLWQRGIVVVASAGNRGPGEGSITIPGLSSRVITVGAYDVDYSGQGSIKLGIKKPDMVVPGANVFSCNSEWEKEKQPLFKKKSGTSMATPVVTGAVADMMSLNPFISNHDVKRKLKENCVDLGLREEKQGSGLLNIEKLILSRKNT